MNTKGRLTKLERIAQQIKEDGLDDITAFTAEPTERWHIEELEKAVVAASKALRKADQADRAVPTEVGLVTGQVDTFFTAYDTWEAAVDALMEAQKEERGDETAHLLGSPKNAERLSAAIERT